MPEASYLYINNQSQLETACKEIEQCKVLCVDTEFHRESTYYPEFALLQIYGNNRCWIIDPIELTDLTSIWKIMVDQTILKVFHAGRQDVEIIVKESGAMPLPLFDSQIAAALLGYGQQIGFGNLVQRITKKELAKQESFSDWKARPLRQKQLDYAADDVIWLMPVYQHLKERLEAEGRLSWLHEEQNSLCDLATYQLDESTVFWRVKGSNRLKGKQLATLRSLAAWREQQAQRHNIPRRRMIADEQIIEMSRRDKLTPESMSRIRGVNSGFVKRHSDAVIKAWHTGQTCPEEQWPKQPARRHNSRGTDLRLEMLDTLVRLKAEEGEIASSILANKSDLSALASWGYRCTGEPPEVACLHGWRLQLVGDDLLSLLRGKICLHLNPKTGMPVITDLSSGESE